NWPLFSMLMLLLMKASGLRSWIASIAWCTELPPRTRSAISHSVSLRVVVYSLPSMARGAAGWLAVARGAGAADGAALRGAAVAATGACGAGVAWGAYSGGSSSKVYSRSRRQFGHS